MPTRARRCGHALGCDGDAPWALRVQPPDQRRRGQRVPVPVLWSGSADPTRPRPCRRAQVGGMGTGRALAVDSRRQCWAERQPPDGSRRQNRAGPGDAAFNAVALEQGWGHAPGTPPTPHGYGEPQFPGPTAHAGKPGSAPRERAMLSGEAGGRGQGPGQRASTGSDHTKPSAAPPPGNRQTDSRPAGQRRPSGHTVALPSPSWPNPCLDPSSTRSGWALRSQSGFNKHRPRQERGACREQRAEQRRPWNPHQFHPSLPQAG